MLGDAAVCFGSEAELRALLARFDRDPALCRPGPAEGPEMVRARYHWPAVVSAYEALFERLARA